METTRTIIDSDILIDLLRNRKDAVAFVGGLEEKKVLLTTTVVNAFELHYGAHKSRYSEKSLPAVRKLLSRLVLLPLTSRAAQKAGHIYADLEAKGQSIGLRDTLIGAIALTREFSVATGNVEHFKKITGLKVISTQEYR